MGTKGSFTMNGGSVTNSNALWHGPAVQVAGGTFTMTGGTITGNTSINRGGGVWVSGTGTTFTMKGGEITGNTAPKGAGGVYVSADSTLNLSGTPVVKDNTSNGTTPSNVYLLNGTPIKLTGALTEGAEVWINYPNAKDTIFATATTAADAANSVSYFRNDADSTLLAGARDTSPIWNLVVAQIWDGNKKTLSNYHTLKAAIADYTDSATQVIQLLENIAETATVDKDLYLNLNGKNIAGALTLNDNCTLYGLDSFTDGYTASSYGKISGTISGTGTVAAITPTAAAHTTKAKTYLKVTEGDGISFHRFNVQVYDYYFRLVFDENDPADTGSAMISFSSAVQGDSHVADAITELETSYTPAGGTEEKTSAAASTLTDLKAALKAGSDPYYYRSPFIFLSNLYTAQYALKVSLGFDLGSGQTATVSSTKDRTLRDILGYFYKSEGTTQDQKNAIDAFLNKYGLGTIPS